MLKRVFQKKLLLFSVSQNLEVVGREHDIVAAFLNLIDDVLPARVEGGHLVGVHAFQLR
jgi:hypothetical protein